MLTVHVVFAKDSDKIAIVDQRWWAPAYEWTLNRFCPCCSWRGWLFDKIAERASEGSRIERFYLWFHDIWGKLYFWPTKKEKILYDIPVENACPIALKIFKGKTGCYRDDCEYCWHLREDAYEEVNNMT